MTGQLTAVVAGFPQMAEALSRSGRFAQVIPSMTTSQLRDQIGANLTHATPDQVVFCFADTLQIDTPEDLSYLVQYLTTNGWRVLLFEMSPKAAELVNQFPSAGLLRDPFTVNGTLAAISSIMGLHGPALLAPTPDGNVTISPMHDITPRAPAPIADPFGKQMALHDPNVPQPVDQFPAPQAPQHPAAADPFADASTSPQNPVRPAQAPQTPSAADPFSAPAPAADPFGTEPSAAQPAQQAPASADPFGAGQTTAPVQQPAGQADPFRGFTSPHAPAQDPAPAGQDPFGAGQTPAPVQQPAGQTDPFGAPSAPQAPAQPPTAGDPFAAGQVPAPAQPPATDPFSGFTAPQAPAGDPFGGQAAQPDPMVGSTPAPGEVFATPAAPAGNDPFTGQPADPFSGFTNPATQEQQAPAAGDPFAAAGGFAPRQDTPTVQQPASAGGIVVREGAPGGVITNPDQRGFMLAVTAPKGGTGKSTFTLNAASYLGLRLAGTGKSVCVLDANVQQADAGKYLGFYDPTVIDVAKARTEGPLTPELLSRFIRHKQELGISVLLGPATPREANPAYINGRLYSEIISVLRQMFTYVVVDTPVAELYHTLFQDFVLPEADFLCVVATQNIPTLLDIDMYLRSITSPAAGGGHDFDPSRIGYIINQYQDGVGLDEDVVRNELGSWRYLGLIPETIQWRKACNEYRIVATANYHELNEAFARILYAATGEPVLAGEGSSLRPTRSMGLLDKIKRTFKG